MKNGHPSREHSKSMKQAHETPRDHGGELRRGVEHLMEHHREEAREIDRSRDTKKERG